eukprot:jgi/Botrbrau1/17129/Bobra.0157s0028.2
MYAGSPPQSEMLHFTAWLRLWFQCSTLQNLMRRGLTGHLTQGRILPLVPPPLAPGLLPEVQMSDFAGYIRRMSDKLQDFEESRRQDREEHSDAEHRPSLLDIAEGKSVHVAGQGLVTAMEVVPSMFFSEEFSLSRPDTWHTVCPSDDEEVRAEKAEEYEGLLDVVETQLLAEIAVRSDHFFEAAAVVQDLGVLLGGAYSRVHALRERIHALDEDVLKAALDVQRLQRRRANLVAVAEKLKVVEDVVNFQEALGLLLPEGDFAGALDVCDDLRATLASKQLEGLHVARHLPQQLAKASEAINDLMERQFLALLRNSGIAVAAEESLEALRQPDFDSQAKETFGGADREEVERDALLPLVLGLWRAERLAGALTQLRDQASADVKMALRDIVERGVPALMPLQGMDTGPETLADKLLVLTPANFQRVLAAFMTVSMLALEHAAAIAGAVEEALRSQGSAASKPQVASMRSLCSEVVQAVADVAQQRWGKLLTSRAAAHVRLRLPELTQLLMVCEDFATQAQHFGAKPTVALRNAVQVQCKAFLDSLHSRSIMHLSGLLEQETWVAAEVPHQAQKLVECLQLRAAALTPDEAHLRVGPSGPTQDKPEPSPGADPLSVLLAASHDGPGTAPDGALGGESSGKQSSEGAEGGNQRLVVSGVRYVVVRAELALLRLLQDYAFFQETVPALSVEVAHRVVELVKVRRALDGLMPVPVCPRSVGLCYICMLWRNVFAGAPKSSKWLGLTVVFTAPIAGPRRAVLLPDFQRAAQDLRIHRTEIHHKLVGIMRERLAANLRQLPSLSASWGTGLSSSGPPGPSSFATTIAKQIRILSQVLSPILLEQELHLIFGEVAAVFSRSLADAFASLEPAGQAWEMQRSTDAQHLLTTLQGLPMDPKTRDSKVEQLVSFCASHCVPVVAAGALKAEVESNGNYHRHGTQEGTGFSGAAEGTAESSLNPPSGHGGGAVDPEVSAKEAHVPQTGGASSAERAEDRLSSNGLAVFSSSTTSPPADEHSSGQDTRESQFLGGNGEDTVDIKHPRTGHHHARAGQAHEIAPVSVLSGAASGPSAEHSHPGGHQSPDTWGLDQEFGLLEDHYAPLRSSAEVGTGPGHSMGETFASAPDDARDDALHGGAGGGPDDDAEKGDMFESGTGGTEVAGVDQSWRGMADSAVRDLGEPADPGEAPGTNEGMGSERPPASRMSSFATELTYARRESSRSWMSEDLRPEDFRSVSMRSTLDTLEEAADDYGRLPLGHPPRSPMQASENSGSAPAGPTLSEPEKNADTVRSTPKRSAPTAQEMAPETLGPEFKASLLSPLGEATNNSDSAAFQPTLRLLGAGDGEAWPPAGTPPVLSMLEEAADNLYGRQASFAGRPREDDSADQDLLPVELDSTPSSVEVGDNRASSGGLPQPGFARGNVVVESVLKDVSEPAAMGSEESPEEGSGVAAGSAWDIAPQMGGSLAGGAHVGASANERWEGMIHVEPASLAGKDEGPHSVASANVGVPVSDHGPTCNDAGAHVSTADVEGVEVGAQRGGDVERGSGAEAGVGITASCDARTDGGPSDDPHMHTNAFQGAGDKMGFSEEAVVPESGFEGSDRQQAGSSGFGGDADANEFGEIEL